MKNHFFFKLTSLTVAVSLIFSTLMPSGVSAQTLLNLPAPGAMVPLSAAYVPVLLRGMTVRPENPFLFDFIIDSGHSQKKGEALKSESERLVKYFMAAMTIPQNNLWVNLSPNEPGRIIPQELAQTEMGRDLLTQDYLLKQITASLLYPEDELGVDFWEKVYAQAQERFGTTDIPTETFHKVWILPESATVFEHGNTVYIVDSKLKVMMEEDYLSLASAPGETATATPAHVLSTQIMKEVLLPAIENEVNEGKNFAPLRQIYYSLILAKWYKSAVKGSLLSQIYIDQNKVAGVDEVAATTKDEIYNRYMAAYQKGVYNYIKEDYDALSQTVLPRKYFSGGFKDSAILIKNKNKKGEITSLGVGTLQMLTAVFKPDRVAINPHISSIMSEGDVSGREDLAMLSEFQEFMKDDGFAVRVTTLGIILGGAAIYFMGRHLIRSWSDVGKNIILLHDEDPGVREEAVKHLGDLRDPRARKHLIKMLWDPEWRVRFEAGSALKNYVEGRQLLLKVYTNTLINSKENERRVFAAEGLGDHFLSKKVFDPLFKALEDEEASVRVAVIKALGKIRDPRAVEALIKIYLNDSVEEVRNSAQESLVGILSFTIHQRGRNTIARNVQRLASDNPQVALDARNNIDKILKWVEWHWDKLHQKSEKKDNENPLSDNPPKTSSTGGIDLNEISVKREGPGITIQFDPALMSAEASILLEELNPAAFTGFEPVFTDFTPLPSIFPLLGMDEVNTEEEARLSLN